MLIGQHAIVTIRRRAELHAVSADFVAVSSKVCKLFKGYESRELGRLGCPRGFCKCLHQAQPRLQNEPFQLLHWQSRYRNARLKGRQMSPISSVNQARSSGIISRWYFISQQ